MSETPTIHQALSAVMEDVQAVGKTGRNTKQNYNFRGVDAVVNAVGPALRKHGVIVVPFAESVEYETYSTSGGTAMKSCVVKVRYVFYGPAGDSLEATVYGESSDAGDKSTPKAHSVAFRTALLQALCIPTDEADPDESSHERVMQQAAPGVDWQALGWPNQQAHDTVWADLKKDAGVLGADEKQLLLDWWVERSPKSPFTADFLEEYAHMIDRLTPAKSDDPGSDGAAASSVRTSGPGSSEPTQEAMV